MKNRITSKKRFIVLVLILICFMIPLITGCTHAEAASDNQPACAGSAEPEFQSGKQ